MDCNFKCHIKSEGLLKVTGSRAHGKGGKILVAFITRHAGGKTLLHQDHPVVNSGCRLMQVVLYNGGKWWPNLDVRVNPW